jgi:hypothetical protein
LRRFRSYAGMTRIRFKGPAHRHLSTVRCSPRNDVKVGQRNGLCQSLAIAVWQSLRGALANILSLVIRFPETRGLSGGYVLAT